MIGEGEVRRGGRTMGPLWSLLDALQSCLFRSCACNPNPIACAVLSLHRTALQWARVHTSLAGTLGPWVPRPITHKEAASTT